MCKDRIAGGKTMTWKECSFRFFYMASQSEFILFPSNLEGLAALLMRGAHDC